MHLVLNSFLDNKNFKVFNSCNMILKYFYKTIKEIKLDCICTLFKYDLDYNSQEVIFLRENLISLSSSYLQITYSFCS